MEGVPPNMDGGELELVDWTYVTRVHYLIGTFDCVQLPNEVYPTQLLNEVLGATDE